MHLFMVDGEILIMGMAGETLIMVAGEILIMDMAGETLIMVAGETLIMDMAGETLIMGIVVIMAATVMHTIEEEEIQTI